MKFISKILLLISCFMIMSSMLIPNYVHAADSPDSVMNRADKFINKGESASVINEGELKDTSNFLYNIFLAVGIIVAVIVGVIIGIKLMMGSIEEKAQYKELLFPYLISCSVIFGAFIIWKIVISIGTSI